MNLKDFGLILYSGWGVTPDSIKQEMKKKYGMYNDD